MKKTSKSKAAAENKVERIETRTGIGYVFSREQAKELGDKLLPVIENIEQFEPSINETVKLYPFSGKGPNIHLDTEQQSIMKDTCGFPVKASILRAWLRQNCNFTDFEQVTIFEILSAMRVYIQNNIPTDLMHTNIVLAEYDIHKTQLYNDIESGALKSYRTPGTTRHRLSEKEVLKKYTKRK